MRTEGGSSSRGEGWHPTSVRFSPEDVGRLDVVAARLGYSRNELIRLLVRLGLRLADDLPPKDRRAAVEVRAPPPGSRAAPRGRDPRAQAVA